MGTSFTVEMYGPDPTQLARAGDRALDEASRIDHLLSNYLPDSELSRVNRDAARAPVKVSQELFDLLSTCIAVSRESEGTFDITVGPLMKVWGFFKDSGHLPSAKAVKDGLRKVGYQNIELDRANRSVHFKQAGVELDPGGVGKGYAVDRMAAVLRQEGVHSALISGGGSSIFGLGTPPTESRGWPIHINDPRDEKKTAADVYLKDKSLSTSGSYEKFFWADGKVYSHIMDPRSGYPAQGMLAVSVLSSRTLDSEIWAKPYFILGHDWTRLHKPTGFRVLMCLDQPGAACAWLP
ncbi:MAG TPA: FAD:protein FMN transferase [Bryobacteraceae bacterium]|jgi:thiamine biosynthesis lipoprotein